MSTSKTVASYNATTLTVNFNVSFATNNVFVAMIDNHDYTSTYTTSSDATKVTARIVARAANSYTVTSIRWVSIGF